LLINLLIGEQVFTLKIWKFMTAQLPKPLLFIKNVDYDTPGSLGEQAESWGLPRRVIEYHQGERLSSAEIDDYSAYFSLGGPYHLHSDLRKPPFLAEEIDFLRQLVERGKPVLGVCLGSQLLAEALGARVYRHSQAEIGCQQARLTDAGKKDPLFFDFPNPFITFHWHSDTFELPEGAVLLAESDVAPHQAFRFGEIIYGIQFHQEITRKTVDSWIKLYGDILVSKGFSLEEFSNSFDLREGEYRRLSALMLHNFLEIAGIRVI
jgi:GMP synthase-like glutamine amidotransferase